MNGKILNQRTIKVSLASDNGRAKEFIRRKEYKDKSRCYECGEEGHLSYECPTNQLGARERPVSEKKKRAQQEGGRGGSDGGAPPGGFGRGRGGQAASVRLPLGKRRRDAEEEEEGEEEEEQEEDGARFEDEGWASVVAPRAWAADPATASGQYQQPPRQQQHEGQVKPSLKGPKQSRGYFSDESGED
eukprot:TRINITY_DN4615_c0_g1_i2.p1 TRINITY_DN4615_c0_g1~~TRINITY_DN4615_c0_g1_i2.p1  ORF type:complete len:188 (-),score=54.67 TRINITY_DN4615_c0_g1_i2:484-1047(-)